jgi:RNA polymerase sigma factor (sigma-70 family)
VKQFRRRDAPARYADDLELARRCAEGDDAAWERFVREYRPLLYRAADALDPSGGARELADSLYGDLYSIERREGERRSLFCYFQGRSSLATWLRAVLARRYVDRIRAARRFTPLPDEDGREQPTPVFAAAPSFHSDPDRSRHTALVREALSRAIGTLDERDRLRLGCYYVQQLTLADTGRVLGEHEATVSRQLARTRQVIRTETERYLRDDRRLSTEQVAEAVASLTEDAGTFDLGEMLGRRKESAADRSVG